MILIGAVIFVLIVYRAFWQEPFEPIACQDNRSVPFTIEQIAEHDGKEGRKCYIGLNGFVFDVSESANFKEGGMYYNFAGREISIACANYSTDDEYLGQLYDPENSSQLSFS